MTPEGAPSVGEWEALAPAELASSPVGTLTRLSPINQPKVGALSGVGGRSLPSTAKTIRYTGSKRKMLPKIELITEGLIFNKVLDAFSGSGIVSLFFKMQGKTVHSNDLAAYSKCIAETFLLSRENKTSLQEEIDYLNSLPPVEG